MEVIVERPAALDVHNASVMACVRAPGDGRRRVEHVAEFQTTVQGLLTLRDWLEAHEVDQVVMEATGVYWKPVWAVLEDRFKCLLVNARHVKQVPGRKTDVMDAQWLCQLLEAGLLRASLVPPKPVRTLRNLTRYRKSQIRDRQREMNRLHKVMQDTGIKLDCVATDMMGKSGRAMLDALVAGTTDPAVLADLARGQLRKKIPALRAALEGRFDVEHSLVVGRILAHIDYLDEAIDELSAAIEEQLGPFAPAVELLCTIPGVGRRAAEVIIAETGGDMTAFPSAKHLASWAGMCPGNDESAGKRRSGKTRKGSKWLSQTLVECAKSANRSKNTYLAAQYARLRVRRGANKATIAVCHSILTAVWHMLTTGETHTDPGGDFYARDPGRTRKRLGRPARTARLHRHAAGRARGSLSEIFSTGALTTGGGGGIRASGCDAASHRSTGRRADGCSTATGVLTVSGGRESFMQIPICAAAARSSGAHEEVAMSAEQVRETLQQYLEVLLARGDYGRFFDDDVEFALMGTEQQTQGAQSAERTIRFLHETAFDAAPEFTHLVVDDRGAAAEAVFIGTHIGDFSGVSATGNSVRVPYSVFYDVEADKIKALRIYIPMDQLLTQIGGAAEAEVASS